MSLNSDELNFLVYRYLQESGFQHSAFTFAYESLIGRSKIASASVPPGALVSFVQKGLQYIKLEREIKEGLTVGTHTAAEGTNKVSIAAGDDSLGGSVGSKDVAGSSLGKESAGETTSEAAMDTSSEEDALLVQAENVTELRGHKSEVFICAWSPVEDVLASGSGDSTARIWKLPHGASGLPAATKTNDDQIVLNHFNAHNNKSKDVTTLDWNKSGTLLATGSYDGQAWVWDKSGKLCAALNQHKGPIFSLKWSKNGKYLLSGSVDKTAIVWDVSSQKVLQQFSYHDAPTLDVDWKDNKTFATCSTDKLIHLCKLGSDAPVMTFKGHTDEVNAIKWSPSASYLASCSDDYTAKIWKPDSPDCVHDLNEHTKEIYTIKWNPGQSSMLASASFDSTIKLWDCEVGKCTSTLKKHTDPVYSVAFSPDGKYLASGSFDRSLHVWNVADGSLVKTYKGGGGIFEVCWNKDGTKIASCFSNNTVCVLDFRK